MKLKIDQGIKNFDGTFLKVEQEPLKNADGTVVPLPATTMTFRKVIEVALNAQDQANPLTQEKKVYAFQIGVKLFAKKLEAYDLTVDQVQFLKERIGIFYGPIIYGRFLELIGDDVIGK